MFVQKPKDKYNRYITYNTKVFLQVVLKTSIGQFLDLITTNFGKNPNLDLFTTDLYNSIAEYKTAYYAYFVAITVAMHFAGIKDPEMFRQAIPVSLKIGQLLQIQDDYLDCFGDPNVCGKDGTDIQNGKCTWFITRALQHTTPQQRKILEECYGVADPEKVKRVKQLFTDLNLLDAYLTYENEQYNQLNVSIQQMSCGLSHNMFSNLINRIYRRSL
ncbi:PREDICTED: farnesyl pyrophosphate synthase-like [Vollenhovia emeryi]|uniref:farnesyl pyrophosphate synthase-like n=1 Tax=Vollenhovia emeryi TaxID=411798 RepID=UPI0005F55C12|nr:PREDICTED: farnesyl pyrophosphate synthase-like [Vollenhovia emeryi]